MRSSLSLGEGYGGVYYAYTDNIGSLISLMNESGTVVERYAYDPWGNRRNLLNWTLPDTRTSRIVNRGYTGHEHLDKFQIINMNGRVYDPLTAQFFSPDPYLQSPTNWLNYGRYTYCLNNPFLYIDPDGEFITWSIGKGGFSIGINLTPIGIPLGFGVNVGWNDGGSTGVYGEVGYRVGGTGLGAGATVSQSLTYSFGNGGNWSTATSAGVYGSYGLFNVGTNVSYLYGQDRLDWGISAGINLGGNDAWGIGLNVGYGSGGFTYGLGGYYNPNAWQDNLSYEPEIWNDEISFDSFLKRDGYNCYTYAIDEERVGLDRNPGKGEIFPEDITLDKIATYAISDGRIKKPTFWNKLGFGKRGYYSILVNVQDGVDYHFYRQDKGGTWSAKDGNSSLGRIYQATNANGRIVTNPANINFPYKNGVMLLWIKVK